MQAGGKEEIKADWKAMRSSRLLAVGKRFELYPIIGIVGSVIVGAAAAMIYSCFKLDVQFDRKKPPRTESVDLLNPTSKKLLHFNQVYNPLPELHSILEEMKEEEKRKEEEEKRQAAEGVTSGEEPQ